MVRITEELVRKKSEHNERLISTLEELSLHQEDIEKIEHIQNWCRDIKILLLQSNLIAKIENVFKFKKLEYLNLAINNIERIENLEQLESLKKLDLTLNFIGELTSVESLRGNYNLQELFLTGNPCVEYPRYRDYVIVALPQLKRLDSDEVKDSERLLVRKDFERNRALVIQEQASYNIQRDEQKIRFAQQKSELEHRMASIEDEQERTKLFWDSKTEHCPEVRYEIHEQQKKARQKDSKEKEVIKKEPKLFAPCGRPYNLNQAKLSFLLRDEGPEYILELKVYKFLDTSYIDVDIQPKYIRVTVKGKIFQLALSEEVTETGAVVQRSQITGELLIKAPKVNFDQTLANFLKTSNERRKATNLDKKENPNGAKTSSIKGTVDYKNIVSGTEPVKGSQNNFDVSEVPDLE